MNMSFLDASTLKRSEIGSSTRFKLIPLPMLSLKVFLNYKHLENEALSWITAKTLQYTWDERMASGRKASLEGLLSLMRRNLEDLENTKFHNIFEVGNPMISTVPVPFNNPS